MKKQNISAIEQSIIDKVREMRKVKGISQAQLAYLIDVSIGFIGKVESRKYRDKYNINHLNRIAEALECDLWDLVPKKPMLEKYLSKKP